MAVGAEARGDAAEARNGAVIRLDHVSRVYQVGESEVRALNDVSLAIARGEFVAIMGPSGSGKSTMLNVLGCLDTPTSGVYELEGEPVQSLSEDRLAEVRQKRIGFIFQSYHLVGRMTAARNVELPMIFAGMDPRARRDRVRAALEAVGLGKRMTHRPDQLSGGERQRVAIARAMVMEPSILLADEPTGNLDTASGEEIVALLERLNAGGLTLVLVTHDPRVASHARRALRMRDGCIVEE
ncbi:MAG: ABC transporter ATP-binding protein [Candidatus Eisenbacteria bacterium]|uniref:ABC transporter ATP-binding protein n=1 Tax=Eiseniibacteriota bacterium TaxID=2212470 RepID=A0A9D6QJM9_UNCEI|nr:ABC transporter ATP-binding protein [Candidatus Eisenbacteria bacterium]MBI3539331.1 ABC transporter ATP-binding protein [Candidatus Eisenbacteria bacterium]